MRSRWFVQAACFGFVLIGLLGNPAGTQPVQPKAKPRQAAPDAAAEENALAAVAGMDFVVTWNFAHINNPFTKMMIRQSVENAGYESPEIVSPDAFLGEEA